MRLRFSLLLSVVVVLTGCYTSEDYALDSSIPRIETPSDQIAYIRTKWNNGRHIETVLYDPQNRILELFQFGRSSSKILNYYEGANNTKTIYYYHNDSSAHGFIEMDTVKRTFDASGRLVSETHTYETLSQFESPSKRGFRRRYFAYTARGDTLEKKLESSRYASSEQDSSQVVNTFRWEQDDKRRITHYARLYVIKSSAFPRPDTIYHFSQRFAYDITGKLAIAWFDSMYLGSFYIPAGPDTIWYQYDSKNRLVSEKHRYSTDLRNKREIDTTRMSVNEKESIDWRRKLFFVGDSIFANNNRVDLIKYHYEVFDPDKHLPLEIPPPN